MKLYISGDMEGVAGVCSWEQVDARTPTAEYTIYRRYYTLEIAAAIQGARNAGATDVLVNDAHGPMRNLLFDDLPPDIRVIFGNRKPYSMVERIDRSFGGAFFVGYHGGIGMQDATLCHTYTPNVVHGVRLNDIECSEATLNAALAGYYGVPVLLVTGDATTVAAARAQMPWITGVVVKQSIGNYAVDSVSPARARELICDGAAEAVRNVAAAKPYAIETPVVLDLDLAAVEQADFVEMIPGFARISARSVRFSHDDYRVVFRAFVAAFRLGFEASRPA